MKKFTSIVFLFISWSLAAQVNLVPNPGFENYSSCPTAGGQLNSASPWTAIPANDVEYFNTCSSDPLFGVPFQGTYNFQPARTGNAYAGIFTYNGSYREYAQVPLISSLQINSCYYVEFFTNRASGAYGGKYATDNICYAFTNSAITNTGTGYILNISHSAGFGNPIISDTSNWTKVAGIYISGGGESFLTVGNFSDNINTDTLNTLDGSYPAAYYFIDDVSVIPIDSIPGGMPAFAGNDTSVAIGDSVFIGQEISNLNCNWYNASGALIAGNTSGIFVSPAGSTHYVVEQNLCGTITYDTVNVNISGVGIHENEESKNIALYPNPNPGEFTLEFKTEAQWMIEIRDMQGRLLLKEMTASQSLQLKPDAENGVYLVHITNLFTNGILVKKLVIQK